MRILFIAPLPPPINGQALASEVFLRAIEKYHDVVIVNTAEKPFKYFPSVKRLLEVLNILISIIRNVHSADLIYLTISESRMGNIKDLLTYHICFNKLNKMFIHLHGGAGMIKIMKGNGFLTKKLNSFFLKKIKGVIILGKSHETIFESTIPPGKLYVVPNFAEDYLFLTDDEIHNKYNDSILVKLLYMSNMIPSKGYMELLDAYSSLAEDAKSKIAIDFAGAFFNERLKEDFLLKIKAMKNINYHGVVKGLEKRNLFEESHIFCLPTYFPYEGQPISILEAYAAGCVVVTTDHSGIGDVFTDRVNGFYVKKKSIDSIKSVLESVLSNSIDLFQIGLYNSQLAHTRYTVSIYNQSLKKIMGL